MKARFIAPLAVFLLVAPIAICHAEQKEISGSPPEGKNIRSLSFDFVFGFSPHFIDMDQFDEDTEAIGVEKLTIPAETMLALRFKRYWGNHIFRLGDLFYVAHTNSHKNGRVASLTTGGVGLDFGYGYRIIKQMEYYIDSGFCFSGWGYELISPIINGRAVGWNFGLRPETGLQFIIIDNLILTLYGGYHFDLAPVDKHLYSGDFTGDNFNKIDFNRGYCGIGFGITF